MALRRAAAIIARLPSTAAHTRFAPAAVHSRDMSGGLERFREGQPVQTKRPAYDERDTAHTDKWLEVGFIGIRRDRRVGSPRASTS